MQLRQAKRNAAKIKLALQGPSGSGKTFSSLLLANGLHTDWKNIAIIDTENHSADLYAHLGDYNVLALDKPFTPEKYIEAIDTCENAGMEVIIIDSISHEWEEILEVHGNMVGNSFTNWAKLTPRHNAFIQKLLQSNCHIIGTIRTKQDYVLSEKNGKMVPEKVGLKGVTRDGVDYEFTLVFDLDIKHLASASKDRTGLFADKPPLKISAETGRKIIDWCELDQTKNNIAHQINAAPTLEKLKQIYLSYPLYQKELEDLFLTKSNELKSMQTINTSNHGTKIS